MTTLQTVCFTGHRQLRNAYYNARALTPEWKGTYDALLNIVSTLHLNYGATHFIAGGALGVDTVAADVVIQLKRQYPLHLTIARPFPSQACKWPVASQAIFNSILALADAIVDVSPDPYNPGKMHKRNAWMVDNSAVTVAVWNGSVEGGTFACVQYAMPRKPILVYDPYTHIMEWHYPNK